MFYNLTNIANDDNRSPMNVKMISNLGIKLFESGFFRNDSDCEMSKLQNNMHYLNTVQTNVIFKEMYTSN